MTSRPELDRLSWDRIATIFHQVLDADLAERPALLEALCGSDANVRREVEAMLAAHGSDEGLLAERRLTTGDIAHASAPDLAPGTRVGPYRIETLIGEGGMGDVYRAERDDGAYRQTVALKVLRPGYRTAELVRRFRIEREALARLVHPNIASILDGGTLPDGRPYLVLQYVDGVPITRYADERALPLRDRLALFLEVARTVQFAHGRLVVHRDIKPSNILVPADGSPRLLDFGIAKLLDLESGASLAAETLPEARLLTPEYASPEQLRGETPGTATDIHALGVLLFELLTGRRPFPAAGRTPLSLERAILEVPAPAPSAVVQSRADARRLRGDLDRIVLMALRKEPERRYATAAQFGEDVERYLAGRPVIARPDSVRYRMARFVGRNRALVAGMALLTVLVTGFATTATLQARRIARERDRAERERVAAEDVLRILTGLFERGDPNKYPGGDTLRVTALLDDAEREVEKLEDDRVRQAALWRAVGRMRAARGEYARAIELLRRSADARTALLGASDVEAARIRHEIALTTVSYRGDVAARPLLDSSLARLRALLGDENEDVRAATAALLMVTSDSLVARDLLARLLYLEQKFPSGDPVRVAGELNRRGAAQLAARHNRDAAALFEASLGYLVKTLPPEHVNVRTVQRNLAYALAAAGQSARAESLHRALVALEDRTRSPALARAMSREALALLFANTGRLDSAEVYERDALRLFREGAAAENWRIWSAQRNLAFIVHARGRTTDGLTLLDSAIALAGGFGTPGAAYLVTQRIPLLLHLQRVPEAARSLAEGERHLGSSPSVSTEHRADVHRYAGMLALASGQDSAAAERFRAAVALVEPPGEPETVPEVNTCLLGVALARLGRAGEARPLLENGCRRYERKGLVDPLVVQWIAELGSDSSKRGQPRRSSGRATR